MNLKLYLFVGVLFILSHEASSQNCDYSSMDLNFFLTTDTIYSLELLSYKLSFKNGSNENKTIISPWNEKYDLPIIEYKYEKDSLWHQLPLANYGTIIPNHLSQPERKEIELLEGQDISVDVNWCSLPYISIHRRIEKTPDNVKFFEDWRKINWNSIILRPGHYEMRAKIEKCKNVTLNLLSNTVTLVVKEYEGVNKDAQIWLINNSPHAAFVYLPIFNEGKKFLSYNLSQDVNFNIEEHLQKLLELFPNSIYAPLAKLYLAKWYSNGLEYGYHSYHKDRKILKMVIPSRLEESKALLNSVVEYANNTNDEVLLKYAQKELFYIEENRRMWRNMRRMSTNNK